MFVSSCRVVVVLNFQRFCFLDSILLISDVSGNSILDWELPAILREWKSHREFPADSHSTLFSYHFGPSPALFPATEVDKIAKLGSSHQRLLKRQHWRTDYLYLFIFWSNVHKFIQILSSLSLNRCTFIQIRIISGAISRSTTGNWWELFCPRSGQSNPSVRFISVFWLLALVSICV